MKKYEMSADVAPGEMIKLMRKKRCVSMSELAARAGTSLAAISRWENGQRNPTIATFSKIMRALDAELVVVDIEK